MKTFQFTTLRRLALYCLFAGLVQVSVSCKQSDLVLNPLVEDNGSGDRPPEKPKDPGTGLEDS